MVHFISMLPVKPNSQFKIHQPSFKILLFPPKEIYFISEIDCSLSPTCRA